MSGIVALGERAFRFSLAAGADRRALLDALLAIDGVIDVVLAEDKGAAIIAGSPARSAVVPAIARALAGASRATRGPERAQHTIGVVYDGEDLAALARQLGMSVDALVALHASRDYEVAMVGFMPGFAYLRGLDPRLVVARRDSPRTRVPARSVAIAAGYTGIYPFSSPGGWHLLGEATEFTPFDARGAALGLGDRVRFQSVSRPEAVPQGTPPPSTATGTVPPGRAWLEVHAVRGPALLVDGGRFGHMHEGAPHGGPMVRRALTQANAAVGNAAGACGIELYGGIEVVARGGRIAVAADRDEARVLAEGEAFGVAVEGARVRYLGVAGGVDVPVVLGGRGTILAAGLGGLNGRWLRKGDRLLVGDFLLANPRPRHEDVHLPERPHDDATSVLAGPDAEDGEFGRILNTVFAIARASDRTGTRLDGALRSQHSAHDRTSAPMVRGAIERTPEGLIVLGPDHPTTGGYPVVAVLTERAMDHFFALPIGHPVRFRAAT